MADIKLSFEGMDESVPASPQLTEDMMSDRFDEAQLSEAEKKMVEEFADKIELTNSSMILQYGSGAQQKMSGFSEKALNKVKTKDLGEIGDMLSGVITQLKTMDTNESGGLFGIFKRGSNRIEEMKSKYSKAETNIDGIAKILKDHQIQLLKDIALLDGLYESNKEYFKELSMYIIAGKKKLQKVQQEELPVLIRKSKESSLPEDAQAVNDLANLCNRFEKKLYDLDLTRMVSIQMAPQIRLVQNNDTLMAEKIQSTLVNTIPLWKSQMLLALGVVHSGEAAKAQREVTDMTNRLLRQNAETLKMATVETAKESERGIVDIETLKHTNEQLISTLDEVLRIQDEGRTRRKDAERELGAIEHELKLKLASLSTDARS